MRINKSTRFSLIGLLAVLLLVFTISQGNVQAEADVLARVSVTGMLTDLNLPVHAHLQGKAGNEYALVFATLTELDATGAEYEVLDATPARDASAYLISLERIEGARAQAAGAYDVLHDDGERVILRVAEDQAGVLSRMGFELNRLTRDAMVLAAPKRMAAMDMALELAPDPTVTDMINAVSQSTLYDYTANLSGEQPVVIGGSNYTIATRHTTSGTPIEKATQYVYEFMDNLGLTVSYHNWSSSWYSGRNVVGEKTGTVSPSEIVLIVGHLDCVPSGATAPGADDNASGSVGVMVLAEIMSGYNFEKTVRYVLFTGEEQGLHGSKKYADVVAGENVVAVYNMDMIAWDDVGGPVLRLHTRTASNPGYSGDKAIADLFVDVVNDYGLSGVLDPVIDSDGVTASDHASFWNKGFSAILAIEDDVNDFNDYYHTVNDTISILNMTYFTNYVKASVGTAALLAVPAGGGAGPVASFTHTVTDYTAEFTDTSTDSSGTINSWSWDFGDSTGDTAQHPTHVYTSEGTFTVTLTVEDNNSDSDTTSRDIIIDVTAPSVPTGLGSSNVGNTSLDLSWTASTDNIGVAGYNVYQDGALIAQDVTGTSHHVSGLTRDTTYEFKVQAVDQVGNLSAQSAGHSVTTTDSGCGAVAMTRLGDAREISAVQSVEKAFLPLLPAVLVLMIAAVVRRKRG